MTSIQIFTYSQIYQPRPFDLFALSRGLNSGKPLTSPCPNCFVISCKNQSEYDFYSTLLFGLWKARFFYPFHVGSVIPYVRISDFKSALKSQVEIQSANQAEFTKTVKTVKSIEEQERHFLKQLALLSDLKRAMLYRHIRK